jgi:hypothetical protein
MSGDIGVHDAWIPVRIHVYPFYVKHGVQGSTSTEICLQLASYFINGSWNIY